MELRETAKTWIEMWNLDVDDPEREKYEWVDDYEYEVVYENPDKALDLVLEILKQPISNRTKEVLAAGPLEQVLAVHGSKIIQRVEKLAKNNAIFANLLGGVWKLHVRRSMETRPKCVGSKRLGR